MRLFAITIILWAAASSAQAATFSEEMLPGMGPDDLIDPGANPLQLEMLDLPQALRSATAQRNFEEAIVILDRELTDSADYASILELAPQIRKFLPENPRLLWLHSLALAATGSLDEARATLALEAAEDVPGKSPLPLLAEAMIALRGGDTEKAADLVSQAIIRTPNHAYAHNLLGIIESQTNGMDAARNRFAEAVRLSPDSVVYLRNLGVAEFSEDRIESAAETLQKALDLNGSDCVSLVALAQVYEAWQRMEDAAQLLQRCLDAENADPRVAAYAIRLQVAQNRFDAALATATEHADMLTNPALVAAEIRLLMNEPKTALNTLDDAGDGNSVQRAFAKAMMGDVVAALKEVRAVSEGDQVTPIAALAEAAFATATGETISNRARAALGDDNELRARLAWFEALGHARDGRAATAADAAQAAAGMLPGVRFDGVPESDWAALSEGDNHVPAALGVLWMMRGFDVAAREAFGSLLDTAEIQQIRYFAGLADVRLGNLEQARVLLTEAAQQAGGFYSAQILLGEVALNLGHVEDALASYSRATDVVEDGGALMKVGLLADHLNHPDVAENALRRFIALYPNSFIGYNQLSWVFVQRETRLDEALELAEKADTLRPGNASVLDNIGWIHHLRGNTDKALEFLREANRRSGAGNPDILYHLAVAEAEGGSPDTSRELLERFAQIAPENHAVQSKAAELRQRLP